MYKRRHSLKTGTVAVEEKRSKRWTRCLSLKSLQKLVATAGLCCYRPRSAYADNKDITRSHPILKRTTTDATNECELSGNSYRSSTKLPSVDSDSSFVSRVDNVQKAIECPLNDAQLQRDLARVAERLNYLLNLTENGNSPEKLCSQCNNCTNITNMQDFDNVPFTTSWDASSSILSVKILPFNGTKQVTRACCKVAQLQRLDSDLSCNLIVRSSLRYGTPAARHPQLSARISADSGFFSTCFGFQNLIFLSLSLKRHKKIMKL